MSKSNISGWWSSLATRGEPELEKQTPSLEPAPFPDLADNWHCLVLGATGTGKTTLVRELVRNSRCLMLWFGGAHADIETLKQVIIRQECFEEPALLVIDDVHLHTEQLELIELVARDGLKSNVRLVISAQLLSDLPQAVWRNCQVNYALGQSAVEQLTWNIEPLAEFQAAYKMPGRHGVIAIPMPENFPDSASEVTGNPLLRRASTPRLAPYEESALARQTPLGQLSKEVPAEQLGLRDHQHDSRDLPRRTRYSRTL